MGKRTLKRKPKRKRKTLRGGDIRNVLREIKTQVDGEEIDGDHVNGFYGRLYSLLEDNHINDISHGNPILDQQLNDIARSLGEFVDMIDEANLDERNLDYIRALRERMMAKLEDMLNIAQGMVELARPISDRILDEIHSEIMFIQEQFNRLN